MANKTNKNKSAKKKTSKTQQQTNQVKAEAIKKLVEHNRDYLKLDITIPLGDTALKRVHTNQWLFTTLPEEFSLVNWAIIAKALSSASNRYEGYVENKWYIETVTIDVDANGKAEMKLGVNAFASTLSKYSDNYKSYEKAFIDATTKKSSDNNSTNGVADGDNSTIKNGWWGDWVTKFVKEKVGTETDTLKKCKKMYQVFCDHTTYRLYYNAKYTCSGANSFESVWNRNEWLNCGDGANFLAAFMECCGAKAEILNGSGCGYGHYVVKVTIDGNTYWCDHASTTGNRTTRGWNNTFCDIRSGSSEGTHINYA